MDAHEDTLPRIQVLSVSNVGGRRRSMDDEKNSIVAESRRKGMILAEVARRHEISRCDPGFHVTVIPSLCSYSE